MKHFTTTALLGISLSVCLFAMGKQPSYAKATEGQEPASSADKPTGEAYQPEVIIDGKWGTGPGEFGVISDPLQADAYCMGKGKPSSVAVDSKGNIFILDMVNNRIQKFDSNGKYLNSITVSGCLGANDEEIAVKEKYSDGTVMYKLTEEVSTLGINIVIDSKDDLYYYLIHPKANTGEVWKIVKDKVKDKWGVPVSYDISSGVGIYLDPDDDTLWLSSVGSKYSFKNYEVRSKNIYTAEGNIERKRKLKSNKKVKNNKPFRSYINLDDKGIRVFKAIR